MLGDMVLYRLQQLQTIGQNIFTTKGHIAWGQIFDEKQRNMTSTTWLQQTCCHAGTENLVNPFAAFTIAATPNICQWAGQPPKLPIPMWDVDPHLIHGFFGL